jgi:hypothetical protein
LVKLGYGTLSEVKELDARTVMQALNYEKFLNDYESAWWEMNK